MKFPTILLWMSLLLPFGHASDPCAYLAKLQGTEYEMVERPFCNYSDQCNGITLRESAVSCNEAYEVVTRLTARPIAVPPIVRIHSLLLESDVAQEEDDYLTSLTPQNLSSSCQEPLLTLLNQLEDVGNQFAERIMDFNYRYIYEESIDGSLLRNFTQLSRDIAETSERGLFFGRFVRNSESMRRLARYIQHQLHYLASRPMHETELVASSMAPWLHAFLYSLNQMDILYPLYWDQNGYALKILVRYHPKYTLGTGYHSGDGVWYILLDSHFASPGSLESYFERNVGVLWEDVEDFFLAHRDSIPPRNTSFLLQEIEYELDRYLKGQTLDVVQDASTRIERYTYALEVMHRTEKELDLVVDPGFMWSIVAFTRNEQRGNARENTVTVESLKRIFTPYFSPSEKVETLTLLPYYLPLVRAIDLNITLTLTYHTGTGFRLDEVVKDILALTNDKMFLTLDWMTREDDGAGVLDTETSIYEIMDLFISPGADTFDPFAGDLLDDINDHYRDIQIALGRFMGMLFSMGYVDCIVGRYIVGRGPLTTIFETVFFNSRFVRQGFYDVYLYGTLEQSFANGQEFVDAMESHIHLYQHEDPESNSGERIEEMS